MNGREKKHTKQIRNDREKNTRKKQRDRLLSREYQRCHCEAMEHIIPAPGGLTVAGEGVSGGERERCQGRFHPRCVADGAAIGGGGGGDAL